MDRVPQNPKIVGNAFVRLDNENIIRSLIWLFLNYYERFPEKRQVLREMCDEKVQVQQMKKETNNEKVLQAAFTGQLERKSYKGRVNQANLKP